VSSYVMGLMAEGNTVGLVGVWYPPRYPREDGVIPTVLIDYVIDWRG
jgi:hypothetical protein